jgi:glycosyltransferase involved in cell wall biosynthesis
VRGLQASVVIPTYNRAELVCRAVGSVLAAIGPDDEVIVVDDGSTDDTIARLSAFADPRVRVVFSPHRGAGTARNHGIAAATKPLVAFLDSDDTWMPDKLSLQRALMQRRPDVLFCFSDFVSREPEGDQGRQLRRWHHDTRGWDEILGPGVPYSSLAPLPEAREDFLVHFGNMYLQEMLHDYIATFTLVVRREEAGDALHFAEDVPTFEDWECFARLARAGTAAFLDCETAWQYGHEGPRLTNATTLDRSVSRLRILERVWGADPEFLGHHQQAFREICATHHQRLAAARLRVGHYRQARHELRNIRAPFVLKTLALLPGPLVRFAFALHDILLDV